MEISKLPHCIYPILLQIFNKCDGQWVGFVSCGCNHDTTKSQMNIAPIQLTLFSTSLIHLCNLGAVIKICFLRKYTFAGVTNCKYFQPKLLEFKSSLLAISIQLYKNNKHTLSLLAL